MILCGCGTNLKNDQQQEEHAKTCSEPSVDLGNFLDASVDYAYAVGYAAVNPRRRWQAIRAYNR